MATRRDTQRRKAELHQALLQSCRDGSFAPGDALPSLRDLARQYELSAPTVAQVIRELVGEGLLHTPSTAGTFVGSSPALQNSLMVLVLPHTPQSNTLHALIRNGFEERVAQLGCCSLTLDRATVEKWETAGTMPEWQGVFEFDSRPGRPLLATANTARVEFGETGSFAGAIDTVFFDNIDGGRLAAEHLLQLGHRRIAFLGLHGRRGDPGEFIWSLQRQLGWQRALELRACPSVDLTFLPDKTPGTQAQPQIATARRLAAKLVQKSDISAIVSVNALATIGLLEALRARELDPSSWPAIVSYDDDSSDDVHVVSALRLPWEKLGSEAADMLWRRLGAGSALPPQHRLVPMTLISRLSCRQRQIPLAASTTSPPLKVLSRRRALAKK